MVMFKASEWALKRFIKFVLKRALSKIIGNDDGGARESLASIDIALSEGILELKNVEFNKIVVQDALFSAFTYNADGNGKDALSIESATCGKIKIKIPWNNLYSDRCELVMEDLAVRVVRRSARRGENVEREERDIRKEKTLLHIYDNNELNLHSENVLEIERAQKENKDKDDVGNEVDDEDDEGTAVDDEKTTEPGAVMKAIKRLIRGALLSVRNVSFNFDIPCSSTVEKSIVSLLIESGTYVHDGPDDNIAKADVDESRTRTYTVSTSSSTNPASPTSNQPIVVNMRGVELRVGEHVVLSRFHARLSKSVHESEHSMYAFSVENSIHASLTERIVNATSQLCEETLRREEGNETHDSESIRNVVKENEWEKSRVNALNKSFLDCILEVKKRDCIEDANDDESSMIDDEFFDCASPEHADDMNIENFSRSVISSFYEESNSCVGLDNESTAVPSSSYCIQFMCDSKLSMEWNDGSNVSLTFDRSSRFEYSESSLMKLFTPKFITTLQVNQSSPLVSLETVSDEVLPIVSINTKKREEHKTVTLSSSGAELFLDGKTLIRIPDLSHHVVTLGNIDCAQNQHSARDVVFTSTLDENSGISNSAEQILQLTRVSSIQYSMTSTRLDVFLTRTLTGQIDAITTALRNLPDGHPLKLKQKEIGDFMDPFAIDINIDSLDVNIDGKSDTSSILREDDDVFTSASEKLPISSVKDAWFKISFEEVALVAALAVCRDQDANFMSFSSSRIIGRGVDEEARILDIDTFTIQLSKLPISEDYAYSQIAFRIFADNFSIYFASSDGTNDDCPRDARTLLKSLVYTFKMDRGDINDVADRDNKIYTSLVVAMSACVDFNRIQVVTCGATSTMVMETTTLSIRVAPNKDTFKVHENFLQNQSAFATHAINMRVRDSFTVSLNEVKLISFSEDVESGSSLLLSVDALYSPEDKSTVIFSFDRPCDVSIDGTSTIASIRNVLDSIMESSETSKKIIEREECDEEDSAYVFIRKPHNRRNNFKEEKEEEEEEEEEESSKIALAATTKALEDASNVDSEMKLDSVIVERRQQNVKESASSFRLLDSTNEEKNKVLSLYHSSQVDSLDRDDDGIFSSRKSFLPLPLNAPESSMLSVHAFAKSINVTLHSDAQNACKGLRMEIKNISNRFDIFDASSAWGYHLLCDGDSINVVDLTPNVAWPNIYSRRMKRETNTVTDSDIQIILTGVRCDAYNKEENSLGACEMALKFSLCPARVRLEQSVVKTLVDFMKNIFADSAENDDFDSDSDNEDTSNHNVYFQLVEITPWSLRLDYCANENVDVYALTAGNYLEALNLIPWGGVSLEVPNLRLVGISGVQNMLDAVSSRIIDCITKDQAHKFVKAFAPVQSANRMTSAAIDIYKNPLAYKQRKGDGARSSRMFGEAVLSTVRFCKAVSLEALKLGEYVSGNAAAVLEATESLLDDEAVRREKRTERDRMPDGFTDGLLSAKDDFVGGVIKAKNAVLRDPLRKFKTPKDYGGGVKAAAKTLIKNAPRASVAALSGTTKATNKVFVGVKNTLFDNNSSREREES